MNYKLKVLGCLLLVLLTTACSENDENVIPAGMGQVEVRLTASSYNRATRATDDWLDPTDSKEKIHDFWVAFVDDDGVVREIASGNANGNEIYTFRFLLPPGSYTAYGFANLAFSELGISEGSALPDLSTMTLSTTNGWTTNIPMTSHTGGQTVTVMEAENQSFEVELVRSMAKLELDFTNNSVQQMDILGYEISPLTTTDVPLLEPASVLASAATEAHEVDLTASPLVLSASGGTGFTTVYVNETNASATETVNEYSIRLKVRRHDAADNEFEEYRYGFTVNSASSGFDYIHRNDWIKLPIHFSDWQFQVEALPFPPIAGFQARMVTADAMSITFNSGGYIVLTPKFRKNTDPVGVWRGLDDSEITITLPEELTDYTVSGNTASAIDSSEGAGKQTGIVLSGDLDIFEQKFVKLASGDIVGKLTNETHEVGGVDVDYTGTVTVTLYVKLGGFLYKFNYNIVKVE